MLGRLVDEMQAAVAGDSVIDVDDQVSLVQVEEAVDGPALVSPAIDGPANLGAGEELVVADHQRAGVDQVEAGADAAFGQMQPAALRRARCRRTLQPSRSTSAALWQAIRTSSPAAALSSSALTLVSSPENRSMLSIRMWQVVSSESAASVETAIVGKRISFSKLASTLYSPRRSSRRSR